MIHGLLLLLATLVAADAAREKGDYDAAIQAYREVLAAEPASRPARMGLARSLALAKRYDEAVAAYTEVLAAKPDDLDTLLERGRVQAWAKHWPEAEADLKAVTEKAPGNADAWQILGNVYLWSGRPGEAAEAYGKWAALKPDDPAPYMARARARRDAGRLDLADEDLEAAGTRGGNAAEIDRIGRAYKASGRPWLWEAKASYAFLDFTRDRTSWRTTKESVRRYFDEGSLAFEAIQARRFEESDTAYALDGYRDLWRRAYAYLRFQAAPGPQVLPDRDYTAEAYQGFGTGWEGSLGYRHMDFSSGNVDLGIVSLAKYVGSWYLRERVTFNPAASGVSYATLARYYFGTADDYLEGEVILGKSEVALGANRGVDNRNSKTYRAKLQKFFTPDLGASLDVSAQNEDAVPAGQGFTVEMIHRW